MTTGHKLLIAAGATVIAAMLLTAAFALGIYVGEHGWTRDGLKLRGPIGGQDKPQGDLGRPGQLPPLPDGGRRPDLVGAVVEVLEGTLMLATPDGPRTIELDRHTRVETVEGQPGSLDDVERGQHLAVFGRRNGDGQVLVAKLLVLLPPRGQPPQQQPPDRP
jgi:hypothetical protein